jgi:hypothetical protein
MAHVLVVSSGLPRRPSATAVGVTDVLSVLQVCPALSGEVAKKLVALPSGSGRRKLFPFGYAL